MLEQEVKLQVSGDKLDLKSMTWLCLLAEGEIKTQRLISTYYDTPDHYLMAHGLGLRLRNKGGSWLQTVKTSGSAENGLHQRQEWEYELDNEAFDLSLLKQTPLKDIMDNHAIWSSLTPLFTTDFIRETLQITLAENTQIEFAYDYGKVTAQQLNTPIHEIEMELKTGSVEQLIQFASMISERLELMPSNGNKARLGYQLLAGR
ncbi:MAG: CYTH domain-containing protein [Methylophaga sp.]|nr:CYTH domain-containing protein [Methylophaga sp.]